MVVNNNLRILKSVALKAYNRLRNVNLRELTERRGLANNLRELANRINRLNLRELAVKVKANLKGFVKKIRWTYAPALPLFCITLFLVFEWKFVEHLFLAMSLEGVVHLLASLAVKIEEEV